MQTHEINLLSGVPCVIREFSGEEQRILSEQKGNFSDRLYKVMGAITVSVGNTIIDQLKLDEQKVFFENMLAADRKKILVMARQHTYDFDPVFAFTYNYKDSNGNPQEMIQEVPLDEGFPERAVLMPNMELIKGKSFRELKKEMDAIRESAQLMKFEDYEDVKKNIDMFFTLPKCGWEVRMTMLTGRGEKELIAAKSNASSHTPLKMRNLCKKNDTHYISLQSNDMDKMSPIDLDYARLVARLYEGQVDTEVMFEHPDAENKLPGDKDVVVDLTTQMAFFFPSEIA